jgi:hypothetical protein
MNEDGNPTTHLPTIHKIFRKTWSKVYNTHKDSKPDFEQFRQAYGHHFPTIPAPKGPPSAEQLHAQVKRSRMDSAPGMDGWKPGELKLLPKAAWIQRAKYLELVYELKKSPEAYYHIPSPALPKVDKMEPVSEQKKHPTATDHRLLSLMSAIYRIESGAQYHRHTQWLLQWIHPELHGGLPGHESAEVSWDAQSHIEQAILDKEDIVICMMDYWKYFDAMEPNFVKDFMIAIGIDSSYATIVHDLYTNSKRYIKIGRSFGEPFSSSNGSGQGDVYSILAALALVSVQFSFIQERYPSLQMGSCVDDRNIRGDFCSVMMKAFHEMAEYDKKAGHFNNIKKMAMSATTKNGKNLIENYNLGTKEDPIFPRYFDIV